MINASDRGEAMKLIDEAVCSGARQALACRELGVAARTLPRWRSNPRDGRVGAVRLAPANKLGDEARHAVLAAANRHDCASLTPHQIVPKLADEGIYLASESTFYRVLKAAGLGQRRGRSTAPVARPLTTHKATGPHQLWCWDITWMPTTVRGKYVYWYMVKDIYSRELIVNEVHETESSTHACTLMARGCLREQTALKPVVLHSDNGRVMKGSSLLATMFELNLEPSYSRPRVSNDNAYAEALFRTAKYCPMWPEKPFDTRAHARAWVIRFVAWYNEEHRHSGLKYVTPSQRHRGEDKALMGRPATLYENAKVRHPPRWTRGVRNWRLPNAVFLNPERNPESEKIQAAA